LILALVLIGGLAAGAQTRVAPASLIAVAGQATANSHAYEYLEELCDGIGGRVTGSPEEQRARQWAVNKMKAIGLQNVHEERWQMARGWRRISAQAEMRSPSHQYLTVASLGWAGSTRDGGEEAEAVAVNRNELVEEQKHAAQWRGKILFLVSKGKPRPSFEIYALMGPFFQSAHDAGAVAVIDGDGTTETQGMNLTHIDPADFAGGYYEIPVVRMAADHRAILERLLDRKQTLRVWIEVRNSASGPVDSANVVGEIPGSQHPDEIVVLGAHLDSWDLGQGATDDGFGSVAVLAAAEAIAHSGFRPIRTIRFVLFTGEEQGVKGSLAYMKAHQKEIPNHVAAVVADMGDGPPTGFWLNGRDDLIALIEEVSSAAGSGGRLRITDATYTFSDAFTFTLAGVPGIDLAQDSADYRYTHHSTVDTFDKVKPENLVRSAAAIAVLGYWIADREQRLAVPLTRERTGQLLTKMKLNDALRLIGLGPLGAE